MADPQRKDVRQPLLLIWVAVCVSLVALVWVDNFRPDVNTASQPAFIRSTAPASAATATPTPTPTTLATPGEAPTQDGTDDH